MKTVTAILALVFALTSSVSLAQSINVTEEWNVSFNAGGGGTSDQFYDLLTDSAGNSYVNKYRSDGFLSGMMKFSTNGTILWTQTDSIYQILSAGGQSVLMPGKGKIVYLGSGNPGTWMFTRETINGGLLETHGASGLWGFCPITFRDSIIAITNTSTFLIIDEHGNIGRSFPVQQPVNGYAEMRIMGNFLYFVGTYLSTKIMVAKYDLLSGNQLWRVNLPGFLIQPRMDVDSSGNSYIACAKGFSDYNYWFRFETLKINSLGQVMWDSIWTGNPQWDSLGNRNAVPTTISVNTRKGFVAIGGQVPQDSLSNHQAAYFYLRRISDGGTIYKQKFQVNPSASLNFVRRIAMKPDGRMLVLCGSLVGAGTQTGWLKQYIADTLTGIGTVIIKPTVYTLTQNYPNPFNPTTKIEFALPKSDFVSLRVFNELGQSVAELLNQKLDAGTYSYEFDASSYPSGVYFYKLNAGSFSETKKMILVK